MLAQTVRSGTRTRLESQRLDHHVSNRNVQNPHISNHQCFRTATPRTTMSRMATSQTAMTNQKNNRPPRNRDGQSKIQNPKSLNSFCALLGGDRVHHDAGTHRGAE
jgi:hypothetical protein